MLLTVPSQTIDGPANDGLTNDQRRESPADGSIEFKLDSTKPVYPVLQNHQRTEDRWELSAVAAELQRYTGIFNAEFELGLTEIAICIDWLPENHYGHFRRGFNGFGLTAEIAINRQHLNRDPAQLLGTLLHELLHAWQERYGRPGQANYHNKEFRDKASSLGLIVDSKGRMTCPPNSAFWGVLERHGVVAPALPPAVSVRKKAPTKLKKWRCQCTPPVNVRVAVPVFEAVCLRCSQRFEQQD